jgi:hypothetical protein
MSNINENFRNKLEEAKHQVGSILFAALYNLNIYDIDLNQSPSEAYETNISKLIDFHSELENKIDIVLLKIIKDKSLDNSKGEIIKQFVIYFLDNFLKIQPSSQAKVNKYYPCFVIQKSYNLIVPVDNNTKNKLSCEVKLEKGIEGDSYILSMNLFVSTYKFSQETREDYSQHLEILFFEKKPTSAVQAFKLIPSLTTKQSDLKIHPKHIEGIARYDLNGIIVEQNTNYYLISDIPEINNINYHVYSSSTPNSPSGGKAKLIASEKHRSNISELSMNSI